MEQLRILIVGFGRRGEQWATVLERRSDMRLAGIVEPSNSATARATAPVWPSLETCLSEGGLDAALICTPLEFHVEGAIECMEAGLAVLIEKPLAPSLLEASRVVEAAERTGRTALVGQNFRFRPHELLARQTLGTGRIGRLRSVDVVSRLPPVAELVDRSPLWDYCLHHLDLLRTRFGVDADEVTKASFDGPTVAVRLSLGGGIDARYRHDDGARRFAYRERIRGDTGRLTLRMTGVRGPGITRLRPPSGTSAEDRLLTDLVAAMAGSGSAVSAADNLSTIALVEAVERSARQRRSVSLAEIWGDAGLRAPVAKAERA